MAGAVLFTLAPCDQATSSFGWYDVFEVLYGG